MQRFTAIIFTGDKKIGNEGFMKWRNVTNLNRLEENAKKAYPALKFINIYDKKTKGLIKRLTF